jgi:crotonobetainyl-CoA:carnitine CoA-transferase CaiB-like acyl-CoA transferase
MPATANGALLAAGSPIRFSGIDPLRPKPAPVLGAHTDELLAELGLSAAEIADLHQRKIVAGRRKD